MIRSRRHLLTALALAIPLAVVPAYASVFQNDPPDPEKELEDDLILPYYAFVEGGLRRAQRKEIQVPARALAEYRYVVTYSYFKGIGQIATDLDDMTLYTHRKDRIYQQSAADKDALKDHRPIIVDEDSHHPGLFGKAYNATLDKWVLTLADKPLYRYTGDKKPGDTNGDRDGWDVIEVIG